MGAEKKLKKEQKEEAEKHMRLQQELVSAALHGLLWHLLAVTSYRDTMAVQIAAVWCVRGSPSLPADVMRAVPTLS